MESPDNDDILDAEVVTDTVLTLSDSDLRYATYLVDALDALDEMDTLPVYTQGRHHQPERIPPIGEALDETKFDTLETGYRDLLESFEVLAASPSPVMDRNLPYQLEFPAGDEAGK